MQHFKICTKCSQKHPVSNFYKQVNVKDNLSSWCKDCIRIQHKIHRKNNYNKIIEKSREYYSKNKENIKERLSKFHLKNPNKRYFYYLRCVLGISEESYLKFLKAQNSKCAICNKKTVKLNVDHNHKTGKIRGLLCHKCNKGLGFFEDNIKNLSIAIKYLRG